LAESEAIRSNRRRDDHAGTELGVLVETIERDAEHSRLVELEFAWAGYGDRIRVICGQAADILPGLSGPYDMIFSDADPEEMPIALDHFLRSYGPAACSSAISSSLNSSRTSRESSRWRSTDSGSSTTSGC
jgi:protein-L-isoaspartate O-methyltransferase